jgi:hypothetical protein
MNFVTEVTMKLRLFPRAGAMAIAAVLAALALHASAPTASAQVTWRFNVPVNLQSIPAVVTQGKIQCRVSKPSSANYVMGETTFDIPSSLSYQETVVVNVTTEIPDHEPGVGERQVCYLYLEGPVFPGSTTMAWEIPSETNPREWAKPRPGTAFDAVYVANLP